MCPAGELLMDHGKILNDNSSNAGTLHNGAGRNYYQDSLLEWSAALWWELHCVSSLLSAWQLNSLQAGPRPRLVIFTGRVSWDEPQTSARLLPSRCVRSLIMWRARPRKCCLDCDPGPRKLVFPVLCYAARAVWPQACGVKYAGSRKYWRENI